MTERVDNERLKRLAEEQSVRGEVVRLALQRSDQADPVMQEIIADALQLLLRQFDGEPGDAR